VLFFNKKQVAMNKEKTFIFKYDPTISLEKMGEDMLKAVRTGKPSVH